MRSTRISDCESWCVVWPGWACVVVLKSKRAILYDDEFHRDYLDFTVGRHSAATDRGHTPQLRHQCQNRSHMLTPHCPTPLLGNQVGLRDVANVPVDQGWNRLPHICYCVQKSPFRI